MVFPVTEASFLATEALFLVTEALFPATEMLSYMTEADFSSAKSDLLIAGMLYAMTETDKRRTYALYTLLSIGVDMDDSGYGCKN